MNDSVEVRLLGPLDAAVLNTVAAEVFDNAIDPALASEFLSDRRHHLVVALIDDEVVGMASAVHYVHPDKPTELWINEVGVGSAHRGKGIGRQLIDAILARGRELGAEEAWLGTEEDNTAARALYAAAGGKEERMLYITFKL